MPPNQHHYILKTSPSSQDLHHIKLIRGNSSTMGTAHKVISACLRVFEFCCAIIILGLLARFFYIVNQLDGPTDSRLTYALSISVISVLFTFILIPPLKYSFHFFPLDLALFVCWIVCYALLQDVGSPNYAQHAMIPSLTDQTVQNDSSLGRALALRHGLPATGRSTGTARAPGRLLRRPDAPSGGFCLALVSSGHLPGYLVAYW